MRLNPANPGNAAIENAKLVISQKRYLHIFLSVSATLFGILSFLTLATTTDYSMGIFFMMNGTIYAVFSFLMNLIVSLLFGLYISMLAFRLEITKITGRNTNAAGMGGLLSGVLSSGCPMCGSLVFGLFGAPLALMALPFQGLEIKALSIILLSASVYSVSKIPATCKI